MKRGGQVDGQECNGRAIEIHVRHEVDLVLHVFNNWESAEYNQERSHVTAKNETDSAEVRPSSRHEGHVCWSLGC